MRAAIVHSFGSSPTFGEFAEPCAEAGETVIDVLAAPLSPIVKSLAAGKHYTSNTSSGSAGFVPGVDGVGMNSTGERVYFIFPKSPFGSMAEKSLVASSATVPVPDGIDDARAAAVVTSGLSSWVALTRRAKFVRSEAVLINGATGSAGSLAVQIASYLGASRIIVTGRNATKLAAFPKTVETIRLDENVDASLQRAFSEKIDVVLDYLWGSPQPESSLRQRTDADLAVENLPFVTSSSAQSLEKQSHFRRMRCAALAWRFLAAGSAVSRFRN
ncbi:NADPH:quinone reductase-like Zn-dependent oxidoreductase [Bradyrhizobium sp. JR4.1]|uniref:zinc-binding alcohol dehydrogenase family protein n=1 Tax=unclassified Bradyrhizobium TaxID=2631580 RepID=UPI0033921A73